MSTRVNEIKRYFYFIFEIRYCDSYSLTTTIKKRFITDKRPNGDFGTPNIDLSKGQTT